MTKGKIRKGRTTIYNEITSKEKMDLVNPDNKQLEADFVDYMKSVGRSDGTILQYRNNLHIFWCWNLEYNNNKIFTKMTKREFSRFQRHTTEEWGWSPKRVRTVRATLSSLSNFIENILDDEEEFKNFRSIVNKIEAPANETVREKTVYTENEVTSILKQLVEEKNYMLACAFALCVYSGRRKAELPRFKVWYFMDENLTCNGALYMTPEKVKTKGRGKNGKMLTLYVLAEEFKPYYDLWIEERDRLNIRSEWLFPKKVNGEYVDEPVEESTFDSYAKTLDKKFAKYNKPFYWHSIRHYLTTYLLNHGYPDSVVQELIGWESADMVRIYDDRTSNDKLAEFFGNIKATAPKEI